MVLVKTMGVGALMAAAYVFGGWRATSVQAVQAVQASTPVSTWAPQFPRDGAEKVFENDKVIVWDEVYGTTPHVHKHVRDSVVIVLEDGPVKVITPEGKETMVPPKGGRIPRFSSYAKAGIGPHAEIATDPSRRPRKLWVELKGTEPTGVVDGRWTK